MATVRAFAPEAMYRPTGRCVNVAQFGDMLFTHTKCLPGVGEVIASGYDSPTRQCDQHRSLTAAVEARKFI
jgi:hypothetical protein